MRTSHVPRNFCLFIDITCLLAFLYSLFNPSPVRCYFQSSRWLSLYFSYFESHLPSTSSLSRAIHSTPFPLVNGRTTRGFSLADQFKILEIKFKFPWGRSANNIAESRTFLHRNKIIHLSAWIPNRICKHRDLAVSFEAVASGATRVKARRLRDRNSFTRQVDRQSLLMFGYNSNAEVAELVSSTHIEPPIGCSSEPLQFSRCHLKPRDLILIHTIHPTDGLLLSSQHHLFGVPSKQ